MNIINLTPHPINIVGYGEIPCSGIIARVSADVVGVGEVMGIPITSTVFGEVENLPDPQAETIYLVSSLVAQRVPEREDVFVPSDSVRDESGRIIGCKSLGRIAPPKYVVKAFDTDYGFESEFVFESKEQAELCRDNMLHDYGSECGAYIYIK